jgi:hypothetical protein
MVSSGRAGDKRSDAVLLREAIHPTAARLRVSRALRRLALALPREES